MRKLVYKVPFPRELCHEYIYFKAVQRKPNPISPILHPIKDPSLTFDSPHLYPSIHLCVKLLLIALHVNPALKLCARSSQLESRASILNRLVQFVKALAAAVLKGVLQAGGKVGDEFCDGSGGFSERF